MINFQVLITNPKKNKENSLCNQRINLPITKEEFNRVLINIGINPNGSKGWTITDYHIDFTDKLNNILQEDVSIELLNLFVYKLNSFNDNEIKKAKAIIDFKEADDLEEVIERLFNLECYEFFDDVYSEQNLGHYLVNDSKYFNLEEKTKDALETYIDFENLGYDWLNDEEGAFSDYGYVMENGSHVNKVNFDDVPNEYRILNKKKEIRL